MAGEILTIGTGKPRELQQLLTDPNSAFYRNPSVQGLEPSRRSELVERLLRLASGGTNVYPHNFNTHTPAELGITLEDLRDLGDATRSLNLMITVTGESVPAVQLLSSEFNHWQGTASRSTLTPGPELPPDVWARREDVLIQDMGPRYPAGDQRYHMESIVGERRMFSIGATREYTINYGSVEIMDRDSQSPTYGHSLNMGDGALDAYIPEDLLNQVRNGQPLYGPVLIRQRVEGDRPDPRVYYLSPELPDARAAILRESDNWQLENFSDVGGQEIAGVLFPDGTRLQEGLIRDLRGTGSPVSFIHMSGAQYQAWQYALSEHSEIRAISPQQWIDDTFGGREQFNAAFENYPDGQLLPLEAYHRVMDEVISERVSASPAAQRYAYTAIARRSDDGKTSEIVESYIYAGDRTISNSDGESRKGDAHLSTNEMTAVLGLQTNPEEFARMVKELREAGIQIASHEATNSGIPNKGGVIARA